MTETAAAMTEPGFLAKGPAAQEKPTTFLRRLLKKPLAVVSIAWVVLVLAIAVLAPWVSPFDPLEQDLLAIKQTPSPEHWLAQTRSAGTFFPG